MLPHVFPRVSVRFLYFLASSLSGSPLTGGLVGQRGPALLLSELPRCFRYRANSRPGPCWPLGTSVGQSFRGHLAHSIPPPPPVFLSIYLSPLLIPSRHPPFSRLLGKIYDGTNRLLPAASVHFAPIFSSLSPPSPKEDHCINSDSCSLWILSFRACSCLSLTVLFHRRLLCSSTLLRLLPICFVSLYYLPFLPFSSVRSVHAPPDKF